MQEVVAGTGVHAKPGSHDVIVVHVTAGEAAERGAAGGGPAALVYGRGAQLAEDSDVPEKQKVVHARFGGHGCCGNVLRKSSQSELEFSFRNPFTFRKV